MKSKRLLEIAGLIGENSIVADIGTDHGYIPVYLIEKRQAKRVIGTDISKGSLNKIISYVKSRRLEEQIDTRLGNGLEVIRPFEVDTLIVAGMGAMLIRDILDKDRDKTRSINHFIFQPMVGARELREYLLLNGFKILDTRLVKEDGKYYEIISAKLGKEEFWEDIYLDIPKKLIDEKHPLLREYVESKIDFAQGVLEEIQAKPGDKVRQRVEELELELGKYREVLSKIEG